MVPDLDKLQASFNDIKSLSLYHCWGELQHTHYMAVK